jgi:pimeloyl-ACP methyl ester carboxylesterase
VVVPGIGDGLWTVGQSAVQLAWRYRRRFWSHRLLILGRREPIPSGFGVEEHAEDYLGAVERLGWGPSIWECISAGGPIGQCAARRRPDVVRGLILTSTTHRLDVRLRSVLAAWHDLAQRHQWTKLYWSMATLNSRPATAARLQHLRPLLAVVPSPRSQKRFLHVLDSLVKLDNSAVLPEIHFPTLIVGGEQDRIISVGLQREMAALIPQCRLVLYAARGHAAPLEHPTYEAVTRRFMEELH